MVDIADKDQTHRIGIAEGWISMHPETFALVEKGNAKKGDVLAVARIAAIMGSKKTPDLIPLCHPIALTHVNVDFELYPEESKCAVWRPVKPKAEPALKWKPNGCPSRPSDHLRHA